jgi:hypothetical protein
VTDGGPLAYVFWHWKRTGVATDEYEAQLRAFHAALAAIPPAGFSHSISSAVVGVPWANGGEDAYEDWYFLRDGGALDMLDASVSIGRRKQTHDAAAAAAAGGTAGLYRSRIGSPLAAPAHAVWLSRADGTSYDDWFALLAPLVREGDSVLWMRRMVLGPTEFCLQSTAPIELPPSLRAPAITLRPIWPGKDRGQ